MRLIDADKLDMSVKVDGDRTLSPISQLIAQTIIENAQTIESDEDCISRKAVIDAIYANGVWENEYNLTSSRIKKAVESLPPVTPKPKTDVLDKIRAEIEQNAYPIVHGVNNHEKGMTLYGILQINKAFERVFAWDGTSPLGDKVLENVPSAQPEIIRCKDCRYYQDNNDGYPHINCKWDANETPDADDFCSGAERRTDEA